MQKIINGIALLSGIVSLSVVVGGGWIYLEKDSIIKNVKNQMINVVTQSIKESLPGMIDSSLPELPSQTGGVIPSSPSPNFTGGALPL